MLFVKFNPVAVVVLMVWIQLPDEFLLRVWAVEVRLGDDLQTSSFTVYREQWNHALHSLPSPLVEWILVNVQVLHVWLPNLLSYLIHFPGTPGDERIETREQLTCLPDGLKSLCDSWMGSKKLGCLCVATAIGCGKAKSWNARPSFILPRVRVVSLDSASQGLQPVPVERLSHGNVLVRDQAFQNHDAEFLEMLRPRVTVLEGERRHINVRDAKHCLGLEVELFALLGLGWIGLGRDWTGLG